MAKQRLVAAILWCVCIVSTSAFADTHVLEPDSLALGFGSGATQKFLPLAWGSDLETEQRDKFYMDFVQFAELWFDSFCFRDPANVTAWKTQKGAIADGLLVGLVGVGALVGFGFFAHKERWFKRHGKTAWLAAGGAGVFSALMLAGSTFMLQDACRDPKKMKESFASLLKSGATDEELSAVFSHWLLTKFGRRIGFGSDKFGEAAKVADLYLRDKNPVSTEDAGKLGGLTTINFGTQEID